ncbi:NAD(P)H-binding protein [uncultured Pseudoteredinibacter sp.]|uniref:NAD(P)H-binding protein n=1 Tax=uncultured Pseudoteredinibacter sp. TaxID=1641701 RepID=UPI00260C9CFE|nr:NAD(P)H-binding protein [uncultured Pseudoteredinibacter sp.]
MAHIVLAGATGYLGRYLAQQFYRDGHQLGLLLRDEKKLERLQIPNHYVVKTDFGNSDHLLHEIPSCNIVVSCLGITKQQDGLSYDDVDYAMNARLLDFAKNSQAKQFMYISVLHAEKMQNRLCQAKTKFTRQLKSSNIDYRIIRPSGFFSDIHNMLQQCDGKCLPILGNGQNSLNPIHGQDLAQFCAEALREKERELNIGGPLTYTQKELAQLIQKHCKKPTRIFQLGEHLQAAAKFICRLAPERWTGSAEFILEASSTDMATKSYGDIKLEDFLAHSQSNSNCFSSSEFLANKYSANDNSENDNSKDDHATNLQEANDV